VWAHLHACISYVQSQFGIAVSDSILILLLPIQPKALFSPRSPPGSCSRHLLANHQCRPIVAEIRHIAQYLLGRGAQGFLEIANTLKAERGVNTVGGLGVGIRRADKLRDGVALEAVWAKPLLYHWHVGLEVVIHVESRVGVIGVEDGDLYVGYGGWLWV
jgi:hypothetical protein